MTAQLELQASLRGHKGIVWCVAWSLRGILASCGADRSVRVWHSGQHLRSEGPKDCSVERDFSVGDRERWVCIAELKENCFLRTVRAVAWGVDGRTVTAACFDSTSTVLELAGGNEPRLEAVVSLEGHESEVKSVAYSSSGGLLASCSRDRSVWIWEVGLDYDYECIAVLNGHSADVKCVRWHPKAEILVSSSYDSDIRVWVEDEDDWFCLETLSAHASTVWCLAFDKTGDHLASVGDGGEIVIWRRVPPPAMIVGGHAKYSVVCHQMNLHQGTIYSVDWAPESNAIVTCGSDDCIRVLRRSDTPENNSEKERNLETKRGSDHGTSMLEHDRVPTSLDLENSAHSGCLGDDPTAEKEWRPSSNALVKRRALDENWSEDVMVPRAHSGDVNCVAWNPADESVLASCGDDGLIRVWKYTR